MKIQNILISILFILVFFTILFSITDKEETTINYIHYAEGYYFNQTNPLTISIALSNVTYNITGFKQSDTYGIEFINNGVTITKAGLYKLSGSISFTGGNVGEYGLGMTINGNPARDCGISRTTSSTAIGNVGLTCLKRLNTGDHLNIVVRDAAAPAQDIKIYRFNLNIIELVETY